MQRLQKAWRHLLRLKWVVVGAIAIFELAALAEHRGVFVLIAIPCAFAAMFFLACIDITYREPL